MKIAPNGNKKQTEYEIECKIQAVEEKFRDILDILDFDQTNHNIADTPRRIAKMYVTELFKGCYTEEPKITVFPNEKKMSQMVIVGPIDLKSLCSHHFKSFIGSAYIAYIPGESVIGVSKFARIVDWFARRPQIQEELTEQVADYIEEKLHPLGLGVFITAKHLCMTVRGVNQFDSHMDTCALRGNFHQAAVKSEFISWVNQKRS